MRVTSVNTTEAPLHVGGNFFHLLVSLALSVPELTPGFILSCRTFLNDSFDKAQLITCYTQGPREGAARYSRSAVRGSDRLGGTRQNTFHGDRRLYTHDSELIVDERHASMLCFISFHRQNK